VISEFKLGEDWKGKEESGNYMLNTRNSFDFSTIYILVMRKNFLLINSDTLETIVERDCYPHSYYGMFMSPKLAMSGG
jgi:hypothetical protein